MRLPCISSALAADELVSTSRTFPGHMRADVQVGVDKLFSDSPLRFFGIYEEHRYETLNFAALTRGGRNAHAIAPAQYHDVDIGDERAGEMSRQWPLALRGR